MDLAGQLLRPASLVVALGLTGCGPGVTLTLRDGGQWSGRPLKNDATHLEVKTRDGRYVICKRDVLDADHAGNGAMIAGLVIAAVGGAAIFSGARRRTVEGGPDTFMEQVGSIVLGAGVVTGTIGMGQLDSSMSATGLPASDEELRKPCSPSVRYVGP